MLEFLRTYLACVPSYCGVLLAMRTLQCSCISGSNPLIRATGTVPCAYRR